MSDRNRKRKLPPGTWIERELFESEAFHALHGFAPQLLILLLGKRERDYQKDGKGAKNYTWINLDNITLTYKELTEKYSITIPRAIRAFDDLLAKGFIEIRHQGGAYQQDKNVYALITKWKFWRPGTVVNKRKPDVKRGFQGQKKKAAVVKLVAGK